MCIRGRARPGVARRRRESGRARRAGAAVSPARQPGRVRRRARPRCRCCSSPSSERISAADGADDVVRSHRVAGGIDTLVARHGGRGRRRDHDRRDVARRRARQRVGHRGHVASTVAGRPCGAGVLAGAACAACTSIRRCPSCCDAPSTSSAMAPSPRPPSSSPNASGRPATRPPRVSSQRIYEPTVDQPGPAGVLMSYAGGDGGRSLAAKPEPERMQRDRVRHARRARDRGAGDGRLLAGMVGASPATAAATPCTVRTRSPRSGRCCVDRTGGSGSPGSTSRPGPATSRVRSRAAKELQAIFVQRASLAVHAPK